jgi:hypothetical protein
VPARSSAAFAGGRIYYVDTNGALVASTVDTAGGKMPGAPQVMAGKVSRSPSTYYAAFAVSENATLVYSARSVTNHSQLTWFDAAGSLSADLSLFPESTTEETRLFFYTTIAGYRARTHTLAVN